MRGVADLLGEAGFWAWQDHHATVTAQDVQWAINAQQRRCDRVPLSLSVPIAADVNPVGGLIR